MFSASQFRIRSNFLVEILGFVAVVFLSACGGIVFDRAQVREVVPASVDMPEPSSASPAEGAMAEATAPVTRLPRATRSEVEAGTPGATQPLSSVSRLARTVRPGSGSAAGLSTRSNCSDITRGSRTPLNALAISPGAACVNSGTTVQFNVPAGLAVTWYVNDVAGGNDTVGNISISGLYTAPTTPPDPPTVSVSAKFWPSLTPSIAPASVTIERALRLFTVTSGGSNTDYTGIYDSYGNPINIDYSSYSFSEVLPATKRWVVRDTHTSVSYASSTVRIFKQDDQVFEVIDWDQWCDFTSVFNPRKRPLTQFRVDPSNISFHLDERGCLLDHLGLIDSKIYWKVPTQTDLFGTYGGQFQLNSGATSSTLLVRTDADNLATVDLADNGKLYAVIHDSTNGTLKVWTRNLTTGKLATQIASYSTRTAEMAYSNWRFAISDDVLYLVWTRNSDGALQVIGADLTMTNSPLYIFKTFPSTMHFGYEWGASHEHVILTYYPRTVTGSPTAVADLDIYTGETTYHDLGTGIYSLVPIWM